MRVRGKLLAAEPSAQAACRREEWGEESGSPPTQPFLSRDEAKTVSWETPTFKLSYVSRKS